MISVYLKSVAESKDPFFLADNEKFGGDIQKALTNLPGFIWSKYPGENIYQDIIILGLVQD